ncbi:MAG TPA: ribosomal protein S18-alanine N-acetyltransferase [Terracidiphilus sp.]|jgi:ribosomal-protein-alanine N-acetyltransferase|nr:ribosomal protein S18-alanine N-acetyltransferase [Terracidiphilus sp.]
MSSRNTRDENPSGAKAQVDNAAFPARLKSCPDTRPYLSAASQAVCIRRMTPADLDRVMEIAESLKEAPQWPRAAFERALDRAAQPRRIALVAEVVAGKGELLGVEPEGRPPGAEAPVDSAGLMRGLKPPPPSGSSALASCAAGEGGEVVGFAVASLLPPEAELETIAVASTAQRHGLARRLFVELAAKLVAAQITEVFLEVRASNQPALGLYRRLGFTETGRRVRYYHDPVEDAVLMRLRLEGG